LKPGAQVSLPEGCPLIFYEAGQWGFETEKEPPMRCELSARRTGTTIGGGGAESSRFFCPLAPMPAQ